MFINTFMGKGPCIGHYIQGPCDFYKSDIGLIPTNKLCLNIICGPLIFSNHSCYMYNWDCQPRITITHMRRELTMYKKIVNPPFCDGIVNPDYTTNKIL